MSVGIGKGVDRYGAVAEQLSNPAVKMNQLIQYAQGTNPLVPSFMALAEIQNRQNAVALQPGQSSPTTVQQDLITKAEAPRMPMGMPGMAPQQAPQGVAALQAPQGVAALPSGMGQQSFAGGGIVAFSGDKPESSDVKDPDADTSDNAYLNRSRGLVEGVKNMVGPIFNPRSYDLPYLYQRDIGQPFEKYANKVVEGFKETPEEQAARFRSYSMTPNQTPTVGFPAPATAAKPVPVSRKDLAFTQDMEDQESNKPAVIPGKPSAAAPKAEDALNLKRKPTAEEAAKALNIPQAEGKSKLFADYEEMLKAQGEEGKKDRETNKYMRLLEAGLGIMGGTSPYALTNIGQGATQAVRGYAQDVAGMRKEQRENIKDLAALGMKREEFAQEARKLDITQQHYNDLKDLGYKELDIKRMIVGKTPEQIQLVMRYASDPAFAKAFQDMSADKKTSAIDQLIMQSMQGGGAQPIDRTALMNDLKKYGING
jgi:hypothetical protein